MESSEFNRSRSGTETFETNEEYKAEMNFDSKNKYDFPDLEKEKEKALISKDVDAYVLPH